MADNSLLLSAGSTALFSSMILQMLKNSKVVSFLGSDEAHAKMNRIVAAVLALVSSLGIHYQFDTTAGTLMISGLTAGGIGHAAWQWVTQYALQHFAYKSTVVPVELAVKNGTLLTQLLQTIQSQDVSKAQGLQRVTAVVDPKG